MTLHNDIDNEETTLRIKITTVLLLAWSITSTLVIGNYAWTYQVSNRIVEHEKIDDARVARLEEIFRQVRLDTNEMQAQLLVVIRNQERVLEALKMPRR